METNALTHTGNFRYRKYQSEEMEMEFQGIIQNTRTNLKKVISHIGPFSNRTQDLLI